MTKEELFEKYHIDESHKIWTPRDSWIGVEIYRIMHDGNLPPRDDLSVRWAADYLDKIKYDLDFLNKIRERDDFGSLFLTAKRIVCQHWEKLLQELN